MGRSTVRAVVAVAIATLLFEAGAAAPPSALAGEARPSDGPGLGWYGPEVRNYVPLAIPRPVAPVHIEGVTGTVVPALGAPVRPDTAPYDPPSSPEEVAALRSEFARVFAQPDGKFRVEQSSGRINFRDAAGAWQPIDLTLVPDADPSYGLSTAANSFSLRINNSGGRPELAELQLGDAVLRLRQLTPVVGPPAITEGAAHFPAPHRGGAVSIVPTPEGFQFNVTLDDATRPGIYHFVLDTGGLQAVVGPDGQGVQLLDAIGNVVASVSPPSIFDALEERAPANAASVVLVGHGQPATPTPTVILPSPASPAAPTLVPAVSPSPDASAAASEPPAATPSAAPSDAPTLSASPSVAPTASPNPHPTPPVDAGLGPNEVLLSYTIDPAWLHQPGRAFPVVLDPTVCIQKGQTTEPAGCNYIDPDATGYTDHFVISQFPNDYPYGWDEVRVGYDNTSYDYEMQRALFYFPNIVDPDFWGDGFELVDATLQLRQTKNFGSDQQIRFELVNEGWTTTSTWNSQPTYGETTAYAGVLSAAQVPANITYDVTNLARHWYTYNLADWKANLGLMARLQSETTPGHVNFRNRAHSTVANRPLLILEYAVPRVNVAFDPALGADFAPTTMPAGSQVGLPIKVTNDGSGFTFNNSGTDHYALGYRWFDAAGSLVSSSTSLTSLPTALNSGATSGVITLPVTAPSSVGQYALRLDLVHVVDSVWLWASDWAQPSLYHSGAKASTDPANTRIVGSSVVERSEFSVAVVGGGGTAMGETQTVGLADGSSIGINLWSRNVRFDGAGGPGFSDLSGDFGLSYFYDSANRTDCSGILKACGWGTNFDEGFRPGVTGSDYVYVDAAGNRYPVGANGTGQLVSSAGVRLERVRHTILDENWMSVTWGTAWSGTGNDPTISTTYSYNSSGHSYKIGQGNAGTATSSFTPVDLDHFPLVSFAVKGTSASAAIGFEIVNESKGTTAWLAYTVGTDFSISGVSKIALGGSISNWNETVQRDLRADAVTKGLGAASERFSVKSVKLWGGTGSGGNLYFDSVRFQGRQTTLFDNIEPSWTANGTQAAPYAADYVTAGYSMQVLPQNEAGSPNCVGCVSQSLTTHPFATWSWRKVGGTLLAIAFHVKDVRSNATGTITYYAGPKQNPEPAGWIQISDTAPTAWATVTRNVLDDARQKLGYFDNNAATADSEDESQIGPRPDPVDLTGFRLIGGSSSTDGKFALFDLAQIRSLTNIGEDYLNVQGDDFVVTLPGRERHYFNRDGVLLRAEDADGNTTVLDWTYDFSAYTITLDKVRAPSDGMALSSGNAVRQLDVTSAGSTVKFQEVLNGVNQRYAEFTRDGSNNLTTVVPARRSSACAGTGPSGCMKFAYDSGSLLNRLTDPRDTGTPYPLSATITWSSGSPTKVTSSATSTDLLRIHSWGISSASPWRVRWQDADGIAASGNGSARHLDLTPNGRVLIEYRALPCASAACGSGGATNPSTPVDKLVEYLVDGIDNYSSETYYRLTGNGGAVTSRRGSFAAAAVDNLVDPLAARLTPWTQSAAQYAASVAESDINKYRTTYTYNGDGQVTRPSTPFANPSGAIATQTLINSYDPETHLTESSDNAFLANGGFESGLDGWTNSGGTWEQTTVNPGGLGSLKITGSNSAYQTAQLLPGQTFRFQLYTKATSGSATYQVDYQRASDSSWQTLLAPTSNGSTSWAPGSYDLSIPHDSNGKVKVTLKIGSGSGTVYFDDVVVMTTFAAVAYLDNGLPDSSVDVLDRTTKFNYSPTAAHPAIFVTSTIVNYTGGSQTVDQDVTAYQTYNAWGFPLVSTDPDGVTSTTTYASNKSDVATIADGLGNTTSFTSYDSIGQLLTTQDPLSRTMTTSYDWFGNPIDQTDYAGIVTHSVYDGVGRRTSVYSNWTNGGSGTSGMDNVRTTFEYDEFGRVTRQVGDSGTGLSNATSDTGYDLLGNVTSATVYPTGTSNARTVTTYYGAAGLAVGTSGPIVPSAGSAPTCPGTSVKCNAITTVDMNGRATLATDAYGVHTLTWYDFAGKAVRQVANYVSGQGSTSSQNVVTSSRYDAADRIVSVTDPLGNVTSTTYDKLDRITKITRADTSWVSTSYKASGRIDIEGRPTATGLTEVLTKHVYDAAGRQTKTIDHYDTGTSARLWLTPFEAGTDGWSASASGFFSAAATSATSSTTDGYSGAKGLSVASGTSSNAGVYLNLSGPTFVSGHAYRVRARVKATSGVTLQGFLGVDTSGGDYASSSTVVTDGTWQVIDTTWTPTANRTTNIHLAIRRSGTSSVTFVVDDVIIWDTSTAGGNTPDWNIPTETVYDAAGRITATVMPPGDPATEGAFVTLTSYTSRDQIASVRTAATPAYPATSGIADLDLLTSYTYDALGSQTDVTDPTGVITDYDYDRLGRIVGSTANFVAGQSATASQNVKATFAYDNLGELLASCAPKHVQAGCNPGDAVIDRMALHLR